MILINRCQIFNFKWLKIHRYSRTCIHIYTYMCIHMYVCFPHMFYVCVSRSSVIGNGCRVCFISRERCPCRLCGLPKFPDVHDTAFEFSVSALVVGRVRNLSKLGAVYFLQSRLVFWVERTPCRGTDRFRVVLQYVPTSTIPSRYSIGCTYIIHSVLF